MAFPIQLTEGRVLRNQLFCRLGHHRTFWPETRWWPVRAQAATIMLRFSRLLPAVVAPCQFVHLPAFPYLSPLMVVRPGATQLPLSRPTPNMRSTNLGSRWIPQTPCGCSLRIRITERVSPFGLFIPATAVTLGAPL